MMMGKMKSCTMYGSQFPMTPYHGEGGVGGQSVGHGHRVHTCVNSVTTVALATTSFCMAESAVWTNDCKDGKLTLCDPVPDLRFL